MTDDRTADQSGGYVYLPADSPAYWNYGTYWRLLSSSDQSQGRSTTFDELFPPGVVTPPHVHDVEEEAFFVLEASSSSTSGAAISQPPVLAQRARSTTTRVMPTGSTGPAAA